jgi:hypothetical protein
MAVKPGNVQKKNRRPSELFQKEKLKVDVCTGKSEWDVGFRRTL